MSAQFVHHLPQGNKRSKLEAYKQWQVDRKKPDGILPFEYIEKGDGNSISREWRVVSYGGYYNMSNQETLYVTYRTTNGRHCRQLNWTIVDGFIDWRSKRVLEFTY